MRQVCSETTVKTMFENWTLDEISTFHQQQDTFTGFSIVIIVLGSVLNVPVICATFHPQLDDLDFKWFVCSLACADFVGAVVGLTSGVALMRHQQLITSRWCNVHAFGMQVIGASMVLTTTMVSLNRYIAICLPLSNLYERLFGSRIKLAACVLFPYLISGLLGWPMLLERTSNRYLWKERLPGVCTINTAVFSGMATEIVSRLVAGVCLLAVGVSIGSALAVILAIRNQQRKISTTLRGSETTIRLKEHNQICAAILTQVCIVSVTAIPVLSAYLFPESQTWFTTTYGTLLYGSNVFLDPISTLTIMKAYQRALKQTFGCGAGESNVIFVSPAH